MTNKQMRELALSQFAELRALRREKELTLASMARRAGVSVSALGSFEHGWANHPCTKMWRGYKGALIKYGQEICLEWTSRGYSDTCFWKIEAYRSGVPLEMPPWLGNEEFHRSHQSNLTRKDPIWYGKFWTISPDLPYIWPENALCKN